MYRRCVKRSEKVRFVKNTFQGALFLHLYLADQICFRCAAEGCLARQNANFEANMPRYS